MNLLHEILGGVWALEKEIADGHMLQVMALMNGTSVRSESAEEDRAKNRAVDFACVSGGAVYKLSEYGEYTRPEDAPENSVALMQVGGVITKSDQYCGSAGMVTKGNLLKRLDRVSNIKGVVLQLESGGGEGYAAMHLCDVLDQMTKPVVAFIDDMACSAAYYIASKCDYVVAKNDMSRIGSIGTYVTLNDFRELLQKAGIKQVDVYATKSVDKNQEYYQAIDGKTELLQKSIDVFNEKFLSDVASNRKDKLKKDWKSWGTGKVFYAKEALDLGLIDDIDTLDNTINSFF